jgi:signal transduction histidine kinase/CheY-like chemotaxis protein
MPWLTWRGFDESGALGQFPRRAIQALRLRGALANDPSAKILHYLLVGFASSLFIELAAAPFWPRKVAAGSLVSCMGISALCALFLLRRGHFRAASWVYLCAIWLLSTVVIILGGGVRSQDQVFYIALSISAAWLVGYRSALLVAAICIGSLLIMAVMDVNGLAMPRYFPGEPIPNWVNFVVAMVIAAVPVGLVLQQLQNALARSQEVETALRDQEEHLEDLVQQRTAELVEARNQSEAANRAKTVFLANMSHELRTPLNAILGFSAMVRADPALSDQHHKDLAVVGRSGEHLLGLIDDVLDMARIETGSVAVERDSFDLCALVDDVMNMIRERAQAKNLELRAEVSSQTPTFVCSDAGKLRQVLVNLVGNAVKYTDEGSVVVSVDATPGVGPQDQVLTFVVEDTGIGIAAEDQRRIFDPFVQAANLQSRKGTGLGLSISRRLVELLGGTIRVDSACGRGSRFRVQMPAQRVEAMDMPDAFGAQQVVGLEPGQPEYRILIVEDQKENWLLLERLLCSAGFQTRVAEDGGQAIEAFEAWRPHFIWLDMRIPMMSGLEVAKRIRRLEGGPRVKIAAVTASVSVSEREEVLAAGLDDFLRKPYRHSEIFGYMARHLGVKYIFAATATVASDMPGALRPDDLASLPPPLCEELERALISLDRDWIERLVSQISEHNAVLASALARLADVFAFTPILRALRVRKAGSLTQIR